MQMRLLPLLQTVVVRMRFCELDLQKKLSDEIVYFDDEELDRFKEKTPSNYTDEEIEEIRDVLYTLQPNDIKPWLESIDKRHHLHA